jgi:hypothetical protein
MFSQVRAHCVLGTQEIIEDLQAALAQFAEIANDLKK